MLCRIVLAMFCVGPLVAQVSQSSTVAFDIVATGAPSSVGPGADVSGGVSVADPQGDAHFIYSVANAASAPRFDWDLYAYVLHPGGPVGGLPSVWIANASGTIDITLTAPTPTIVELELDAALTDFGAIGTVTIEVPGHAPFHHTFGDSLQPMSASDTLLAVVGPAGLVVRASVQIVAVSTSILPIPGSGQFDVSIGVDLVGPLPPVGCPGAGSPILLGAASAASGFTVACPTMQQPCVGPRLLFFGMRGVPFEVPAGLGCGTCTFAIIPSWGSVADSLTVGPGLPVGMEFWTQCGCVAQPGGGLPCVDLSNATRVTVVP